MKVKPIPKKDIAISPTRFPNKDGTLEIIWLNMTVISADAKSWLEKEAPQFGRLAFPQWRCLDSDTVTAYYDNEYTLFVAGNWDSEEVLEYLESYNDPD